MRLDKEDILSTMDYNIIMRREGYSFGYYGRTVLNNLVAELNEKLRENILKAKGVSLIIYYSNEIQIRDLKKIENDFFDLLNEEADIVTDSILDEDISEDKIEYEVLLTGI